MKNTNNNIESLFAKILKEEIDKKSKSMSSKFGEWMEIDTNEELHGNQIKLDVANPKGKLTPADFQKLRSKKKFKDLDEDETYEGNAFTGALDKARDKGEKEFKVDGKTYDVHETLKLTETELIDLIESLVKKQMNEVENSDNIKGKTPEGLKTAQKAQKETKNSNDDYAKEVMEKMKEYLKNGSEGEFSMKPKDFPRGNGELGEMKKRAYKPSKAVEEYIEAFAHPALENIKYDEIKPNEEKVSEYIEGSSKAGNNPKWANAVETDLGKKINEKRKKNLYQKEKGKSYNRVTQPVDEDGEGSGEDSLDKMFTKLESKEDRKTKLVSEELNKIISLYSYNAKTQ
jgi:hypothetical protein